MPASAEEYDALKGFFARIVDQALVLPPTLPPEAHPLAVLARLEAESMAAARKGLAMALGDIIEALERLPREQVLKIDSSLVADGLPTLTEVRLRFQSRVAALMKLGHIRSERDYYALRNVVEAMPDDEREKAWQMLARYEEQVHSQ